MVNYKMKQGTVSVLEFIPLVSLCAFGTAFIIPLVNLTSSLYISRRIQHFESTDLPGAAEEALRLRAKLRMPSVRDWRGGLFMCRDVGRRGIMLSYRLGW